MAIKLSTDVRNAQLDAIETTIGASPVMKIFDDGALGANVPAAVTDADVGTVLATITLPADWMAAASNGAKAMSGTWEDTAADASGTAEYFRIYTSGGVCKMQGIVSKAGGGGDMIVDNDSFASGQPFTVNTFTLQAGNG